MMATVLNGARAVRPSRRVIARAIGRSAERIEAARAALQAAALLDTITEDDLVDPADDYARELTAKATAVLAAEIEALHVIADETEA